MSIGGVPSAWKSAIITSIYKKGLSSNPANYRPVSPVYKWIKDFFHGHSQCTKFAGSISELTDIVASVLQGSATAPAAYMPVTAADLHFMHDTNKILKFADDTYLTVTATSSNTCADELSHIQSWATDNILKLNCAKSKEIIFQSRSNRGKAVQLPAPQGIERVDSITALGVVISNRLTATDHISYILTAF